MTRILLGLAFAWAICGALFAAEEPKKERLNAETSIAYGLGLLEKGDEVAFLKEMVDPAALKKILNDKTVEELLKELGPSHETAMKDQLSYWKQAVKAKPTYNAAKTEAVYPEIETKDGNSKLTLVKVGDLWYVDPFRSDADRKNEKKSN